MNAERNVDAWAEEIRLDYAVGSIVGSVASGIAVSEKKVARPPLHVVTITSARYIAYRPLVSLFIDIRILLAPPHFVRCVDFPERDPRRLLLLPEFVHCMYCFVSPAAACFAL
jgi:hypothetical protein